MWKTPNDPPCSPEERIAALTAWQPKFEQACKDFPEQVGVFMFNWEKMNNTALTVARINEVAEFALASTKVQIGGTTLVVG
jgi:hypothetical protein